MKKYIIILLFIVLFYSFWLNFYQSKINFDKEYNSKKQELLSQINEEKSNINQISFVSETYAREKIIAKIKKINIKKEKIKKDNIKKYSNLKVDFFPQSPFWKWWPIFNDTCEEASALIAINYIRKIKMTREDFRDELLKMVDWQNNVFWDFKNTDVNQTATILKDYFKFSNYEILENPSIFDIKKNINDWNIIISPFYWVWLNPNYYWAWPEYHFMVIKWYTTDSFISHDVWTKYWKNYKYDQEDLLERIHDYNKNSIKDWKKRLIVLKL